MKSNDLSLSKDLFNFRNGLLKKLGLESRVLDLAVNLVNDGLSKSLLFFLADLSLVSDPRVKNGLGFMGEFDLLLKLESLGLKLDSLLGDSEKRLGDRNNILDLVDSLDSLLDGSSVGITGLVQDLLDIVNVRLSPFLVSRGNGLGENNEESSEDGSNAGFGIDNVKTVGNGVDTGSGSGSKDTGLGNKTVTGEGRKDRRSLSLGVDLGRVKTNKGTMNTIDTTKHINVCIITQF